MLRGLVVMGAVLALWPASAGACSWFVQSNPDAVNIAYPDESANYWGTTMAQIPATGLVVRGRFPHARYFSLHAYDPLLRPVGAIADYQIQRKPGKPRSYEVRIVPEAKPEQPAPNTIYAGAMYEGAPNPGGIVLYRVYVPRRDATGGVGLPDVSFAAGGQELPPFTQCDLTGNLPDAGVNDATREHDYPDSAPRTRPTKNEPEHPVWNKFFGYGSLLAAAPDNPVTPALAPGGGGFLSNVDNDYVTAGINRTWGDVVVFRAKMPTRRQLRYWSICQNETYSQRYVACVADYQAVVGRRHRATFVISDPGDRPRNADRAHGVNWLPWGAYPEGRVIYRQMVAAPTFKRAIARIDEGQDARASMGAYYPRTAYCTKQRFEAGGAKACLAG
jgi:hypothetical protein